MFVTWDSNVFCVHLLLTRGMSTIRSVSIIPVFNNFCSGLDVMGEISMRYRL